MASDGQPILSAKDAAAKTFREAEVFEKDFLLRTRMQNTKILVFGRVGQVGWELRHKLACLGEVTAIDYPEIDFSKPDSIRTTVRAAEPTVIINAAAYTAVDKAESDPDLAMAINGTAPGVIAEEAKRLALFWCTIRRITSSTHQAVSLC